MTDEELHKLVLSIFDEKKESDRQLEESNQQLQELQMAQWKTDRHLEALIARQDKLDQDIATEKKNYDIAREADRYGVSTPPELSVIQRYVEQGARIGNIDFDIFAPYVERMNKNDILISINSLLVSRTHCAIVIAQYFECRTDDIQKIYENLDKTLALLSHDRFYGREKYIFVVTAGEFTPACEQLAYKYGFALMYPYGKRIHADTTYMKVYHAPNDEESSHVRM